MYNGQIINFLIESRSVRKKDLIISIKGNNSTIESIIHGNPTVKTLEKVANFFDVSMDVFFDRQFSSSNTVGNISGSGNNIQNGHNGRISVAQSSNEKEIEHLKSLLMEKEQMIKEKEQMVKEKDQMIKEKERFIQMLMNK